MSEPYSDTQDSVSQHTQRRIGAALILLPILFCILVGYAELTRPLDATDELPTETDLLSSICFLCFSLAPIYLPPVLSGIALLFLSPGRILVFFSAASICTFSASSFFLTMMIELMRPSSVVFQAISALFFFIGPVLGVIMLGALLFLDRIHALLLGVLFPFFAVAVYIMLFRAWA